MKVMITEKGSRKCFRCCERLGPVGRNLKLAGAIDEEAMDLANVLVGGAVVCIVIWKVCLDEVAGCEEKSPSFGGTSGGRRVSRSATRNGSSSLEIGP